MEKRIIKPSHLRLMGYGWAAFIVLTCIIWVAFILISHGNHPNVWDYLQSGMTGLIFLIIPNLFYFSIANMLEGEGGIIKPEDKAKGFFAKAIIVVTILMIFGCYQWVVGLLNFYHSGLRVSE